VATQLLDANACLPRPTGTVIDLLVKGFSIVCVAEILELFILCGEGPTAKMALSASEATLTVESILPLINILLFCGGGENLVGGAIADACGSTLAPNPAELLPARVVLLPSTSEPPITCCKVGDEIWRSCSEVIEIKDPC